MGITVNGHIGEVAKAKIWADLIFFYIMKQPVHMRKKLYDKFMNEGGEKIEGNKQV